MHFLWTLYIVIKNKVCTHHLAVSQTLCGNYEYLSRPPLQGFCFRNCGIRVQKARNWPTLPDCNHELAQFGTSLLNACMVFLITINGNAHSSCFKYCLYCYLARWQFKIMSTHQNTVKSKHLPYFYCGHYNVQSFAVPSVPLCCGS
jgi:hypothetical protein